MRELYIQHRILILYTLHPRAMMISSFDTTAMSSDESFPFPNFPTPNILGHSQYIGKHETPGIENPGGPKFFQTLTHTTLQPARFCPKKFPGMPIGYIVAVKQQHYEYSDRQ